LGGKPRVLLLANVPRLSAGQRDAVERFLAADGDVLVALGDQVDARFYNEHLYRGGKGWLPARLERITDPEDPARPLPGSFTHPALGRFPQELAEGLGKAEFRHWWKVTPAADGGAVAAARLAGGDPLLVEGGFRGGRVFLCAVPLDNSWCPGLAGLP